MVDITQYISNRPQPTQAPPPPQRPYPQQRGYPPQQYPRQQYRPGPAGEWGRYEGSRTTGVMKSEFDQKIHLIEVSKDIDFGNLISLVTKELDTSFINEQDLKVFYQINFENVLEWANMGLIDLAKIRLSKLFAELKLEKSVGGFERILQGASLHGQVVAPLPAKKSLFTVDFFRKQEGPQTLAERMM